MKIHRIQKTKITLFFFAAGMFFSACSKEQSVGSEEPENAAQADVSVNDPSVLIRVNGVPLTVEDYKKQAFYFNPLSRLRADIPEERLQSMIEAETLIQEAGALNLAERPHIKRQVQQILINELLKEKLAAEDTADEISDADIQAYYDEHIDQFQTPASVKVAHILISEEGAEQKVREILDDPSIKTTRGFDALVRRHSDDKSTSIRGGDLGHLALSEDNPSDLEDWQRTIVQAAQSLPRIGMVFDKPVETEKGYHIIKLTGRRKEQGYSLVQVKPKIQRRLIAEIQAKSYREYVEGLLSASEIQRNEAGISSLLEITNKGDRVIAQEKEKAEKSLAIKNIPDRKELKEDSVERSRPIEANPSIPSADITAIRGYPISTEGLPPRPDLSPAYKKVMEERKLNP